MIPTIGRIIIVKGSVAASNGADRAPAMITRVWNSVDTRNNPAVVNAIASCDLGNHQHVASVTLYDTEAEADAANQSPVAFWPPRE